MKNKTVPQWIEISIVVGCIVSFTLANALHVIIPWLANPPGFVFTGIAHYVADYFLYVDIMAQGATGRLAAFPHFTNEILPASALYWYNTLIGWTGHLVGFSPFASYNVALVSLVVILCYLWYVLVRKIYPTNRLIRITAFIFVLSASNFVDLAGFFSAGRLDLIGQLWLSPSPAFNRLGGVPHQVLQTILLLLLIIVFSRLLKWSHKNFHFSILNSLFFILLAFATATATPIQTALLIAAAGLTTFWFIRNYVGKRTSLRLLFPFFLFIIAALPGLFLAYQWFLHPVFAAAKAWEGARLQIIPLWDMFLSIGPVAPLSLFGVIPFLRNITPLRMLLFLYGVGSYLAFYTPAYQIIGSANPRWLAPAPHAIWAILAAQGVWSLSQFLSKFSSKISNIFVIWHLTFVIIYMLFTLPALYSQLDMHANPKLNPILSSDLNHVPKPVTEALAWLKNQPEVNSVVLTDPSLPYDVLVPVFTGKISFTGHPIHTLYPDIKESLRKQFFYGTMSESDAKQFLTKHRIGWIISSKKTIPLTTRVFSNEQLSVFRVSTM